MKSTFRRLVRPLLERQLKRLVNKKHLKVIAVVGSVGKTSTKLAIATVLGEKFRTLVHTGNYNDSVSVPLAAFDLDVPSPIINPFAWLARLWHMEAMIWGNYPYRALVLELGTDHPGEIPHFMTYLHPDVAVVTAVTPEHMEFFKTMEAVAAEELAVGQGSKVVIINADAVTPNDRRAHLRGASNVITYGHNGDVRWTRDGRLRLGGTDIDVTTQLLGAHSRQILLAAAAAGHELGLSAVQLSAGLAKVKAVPGRMQLLAGQNGSTIIDDTYNSSPAAVVAALETLSSMPPADYPGRRIAILGTMNELGEHTAKYHREVGTAAAGVDLLITIGQLAREHLGPAAVAAGLDPTRFKPADSPYVAGQFLSTMLKPGDVILAKGSQNGVFAEEAVKQILADPADAAKLVRQSRSWIARKHDQFGV